MIFYYYYYMNPILIAAAIIPAVILFIQVYRSDKWEKEPIGLLVSLALLGILATMFAMLTERAGIYILSRFMDSGSLAYQAVFCFGVVALSEEGFKYLMLRRRTWRSPAFNYQFDGIVYSAFVSLGFALWENISYVLHYGLGTALLRAVTAVPGHACFGVFMGAWYGLAKRYDSRRQPGKSRACRILALLSAALLHGCYDFSASFQQTSYGWIFAVFVLLLFLAAFLLVRKASRNDRYVG